MAWSRGSEHRAVGPYGLPGDPARLSAYQPSDDRGNVPGVAEAVPRAVTGCGLYGLRGLGGTVEGVVDRAGSDRVDGDAAGAEFLGGGQDHALDGGLGG
jgi:hypothetical protein